MRNNDFYRAWRTLPEIEDYVEFLTTLAPENMDIVDIVAGSTYEENEIKGIRVNAGNGTEARPSFIMHGCHHSGEWITAMGMVYFIEQLITTYGTDPALTRIADSFEFDLIPVMNVDGFLFGWANDAFRTWRKTVRPFSHFSHFSHVFSHFSHISLNVRSARCTRRTSSRTRRASWSPLAAARVAMAPTRTATGT